MTDASAAPPAPAAPGAPVGFDAPEAVAARETIKTRIGDKEFGAKLIAQDAAARAEWDALHKAGYPAPQRITSTEDVNNQAAARNEEGWNNFLGWVRQRCPLSEEQVAEIRGGVIREDLHNWAREQKDRVIKDRGFYKKLMEGDRATTRDWELLKLMLSLRPVKVA